MSDGPKRKLTEMDAVSHAEEIAQDKCMTVGFRFNIRGLVKFANSNPTAAVNTPIGMHVEFGDGLEADFINPPQENRRPIMRQEMLLLMRGTLMHYLKELDREIGTTGEVFDADTIPTAGVKA